MDADIRPRGLTSIPGASSTIQHEDPSPFGTQLEGMLSCFFPSSPVGGHSMPGTPSSAVGKGCLQSWLACDSTYLALGHADRTQEVDRAIDNLVKSGKLFGMPTRRDSMPLVGGPRPYSDYGKQ